MSFKGNIKKILFVALWCIAGAGLMVLLVAAINKRNGQTCKGYEVRINNGKGQLFVSQGEIIDMLTANGKQRLTGKSIISFDLRKMEDLLKRNVWIKEAQLFFDNNEELRVRVTEREPVARIFTSGGNTFYMDSSGAELPLSDKLIVRLPVFTSFPAEKMMTRGADSLLITQMSRVANFIRRDSFWMAQIGQIDILPSKTFEMVPVVGNHVIEFGDGDYCRQKFSRLLIFYKEILSKTGFDRYNKVDVRFAGQVIGTKKGNSVSRADSLLAVKNIQQLIKAAQQLQFDSTESVDERGVTPREGESYFSNDDQQKNIADTGRRVETGTRAAGKKTGSGLTKEEAPVQPADRQPKAVMKKKGTKQ